MNLKMPSRLVRTSVAQQGVWKDGQWWIEDGRVYDVNRERFFGLSLSGDAVRLSHAKNLQGESVRPK